LSQRGGGESKKVMEEKTVIEWLEQAKADGHEWADDAIKHTLAEGDTVYKVVACLSEAVGYGFVWRNWDDTSKWSDIWNSLDRNDL